MPLVISKNLRISKINLEEAVKEGSSKGVLASALGHVKDTAFPGEDSNCCIAGHRNYVFGKYFNRLEEVSVGDIIELETRDSLYRSDVAIIALSAYYYGNSEHIPLRFEKRIEECNI